MNNKMTSIALMATCLGVSSCGLAHKIIKPKAPTGQVVARVDGKEITMLEMRSELTRLKITDLRAQKTAQTAVVSELVNRRILANAARKQGLDKSPEFAVQKQQVEDNLLITALEKKLVDAIPAPTPDEAQRYIAANPNLFADRRVFVVDQLRMTKPSPETLKELAPLHSLEDVEKVLTQNKVASQRLTSKIDALQLDPRLLSSILALPDHEVFIIPNGDAVIANQIKSVTVEPFTGDAAVTFATKALTAQRKSDAVTKQFQSLIKADSQNVAYNKAYQPAPAAAPINPAKK
jgi:EpsD family peptidyl-prolyl cis-trans isomerase